MCLYTFHWAPKVACGRSPPFDRLTADSETMQKINQLKGETFYACEFFVSFG